jgi:hypothetical protein
LQKSITYDLMSALEEKMPTLDRQKQLKEFIARRHPEYEEHEPIWDFLEDTYEGGREWFEENIFRYIKEGDKEFEGRVERAYRFNHTREVVDLVDKYLFKMSAARNVDDAPPGLKEFWKKSTLNGLGIRDFMRRVSNRCSVYGRVGIVVDSTKRDDAVTVAEEKKSKARVYAYLVKPQSILDMSFDEFGELNWILIYEEVRDDLDPIESSGEEIDRYRLWTRDYWQVFTVEKKGDKVTIIESEQVVNPLGVVPVILADNTMSDEQYCAAGLIDDVAYLDRAVANYLSNLDAIIQDQTFSQLIMPAQGLLPGEEGYDKLIGMGTKRIFTYDSEHGGRPEYISPDANQAEIILRVINKIINEIYHSVGLAGERTKEDNALGIDNSSGVAKAYDFERVNSLLAAKADSLEVVEEKLCWLVAKWNSEESRLEELEESLVSYPDNFDVRGLYDEFEIAARLSLIEAPDEVRRKQMEGLIDKLFPQLGKDLRDKMMQELKSWPPKEELEDPKSGDNPISKSGKNILANELVK